MTPLDQAHAAMEAAPENDAARLAFYGLFAATELFLLLADETDGDSVTPALFEVEGAHYLLAFDLEERLSAFTGEITPYAALPGRGLVHMVEGQGIGIAFNAEMPSAVLIPPEAVDWLAKTLSEEPEQAEARPTSISAPRNVPQSLLAALDQRLAAARGLAAQAYLAAVDYDIGAKGHLLAVVDATPGAEKAIANAVNEALTFSGIEAGWLDVTFLASTDPALAPFARAGLRFDLPQAEESRPIPGAAPGMDPAKPPKLN